MSHRTTFVRLFVGFLLSATGVHASCPIEVSPPHVVVRHGDPVSSTCSTSEIDFEGIGWEATEGGTGLEPVNNLTWTVNKLTNWDVSASCYITPTADSTFGQCNVELDVVVYTFPETISITSTSGSSGVMRETEQHNFTCDIHNIAPVQNLTVRWYKGDTLCFTDILNDLSKKPVNQSSVLRFTPSREDNGVTFRCEAHMDLGPEGPQFNLSSKKISIEVLFGPDVWCSAPELREGETLEKLCLVTGYPTPNVSWLKDGQTINPAVNLTREMAGLYTIKAEGFSSTEKNLWVLVLYGPELTCPSTYTALEYAPHNLTCVVEGYPQPEINWYKDGEEVEHPGNLTRRDTGQYLIIASTNLSNVTNTIEITVIYPPSQIVELEDSEVDVGSTVWLKCSSMGNPRPKYLWNYYQAANVREENEDGVSRLVIHNAKAYNMGSYTCHAWNDIGNVSKTVRVTVKGVHASCPIEVSPPHVVVRHGDPVSSTCSTSEIDFEGIGWEATEGGTGLEPVNNLTWTVNKLTNWDVSASCYITPTADSTFGQCNVELDVVVYTFPETISITSTSGSSGVMRETEQHNFTCDIHNIAPVQNLTVRWYKGDTLCFTDILNDLSKKPVNQSSVLRFTPSREDNGVTFRCEAHMDLGPEGPQFNLSSKKISIEVLFGPDVWCSAPELREGETLEKLCLVTGYPTPNVSWLKDGQTINPAVNLTREMAGLYTIKAEGFSSTEKNLWVLVLYGPELTCPSTYTALEYAPHNLTCVVEGYPQPEINWYKDGEEVEHPGNLTRRDTGQYLIIASTNLSNVTNTIEITVIYPPSQIVELEDSEVDVGSTVWLKCSSMGNPRPKYLWNYYQAANVREENEDGVSRLVIHNAKAYNMGSYTCHAWNDIGNVSKTVRVTVKGAKQECPIKITPDRMVIQYQGSGQNATCKPTSTGAGNLEGEISWEILQGHRTNSASLVVNTHEDWDLQPVCTATFKGIGPCHKRLDFTLYKTPDSVSIHRVDNSSLVVEGIEFQLQCYITNVAPVRSLTVQWYRGNETFQPHTEGSMQVTGCPPGTRCDISEIRSQLSVSSTVNVTLNRTDNGAEFRCAAQLDLGLQPPPNMMSSPLNITVLYKPTINTTKLPKTIPVFNGYPEELVCEADGHPAPKIQWFYVSDKEHHLPGDTLTVSEAGFYTCNASNEVDTVSHEVEVILKEDYLPLIAGFVAITVVVISVIFIFIYSIYYKNTKMRRYSLKNPKLSTHNGNVAHNGWDMQFPMTKLS